MPNVKQIKTKSSIRTQNCPWYYNIQNGTRWYNRHDLLNKTRQVQESISNKKLFTACSAAKLHKEKT